MSTAQHRQAQALGWLTGVLTSSTVNNLNAAATWSALSFVPDAARTLNAARTFVQSVTGTLAGTDVTCDLYDSAGTSGTPGAAIESGKLPSATITGAGWYDFTGFSTALTSGQQYWLVFKNVNAVPASNFPKMQSVTNLGPSAFLDNSVNRQGWGKATTTNSGGAWSTTAPFSGIRLAYADGSYDGVCVDSIITSSDLVYSTRESGVKFTTPPNGVLNVAGIAMLLGNVSGSPTAGPRFGLWTGSSPSNLAYTTVLPLTAIGQVSWLSSYFAATQTLQPSTICRVTLAEGANSDTSIKAYVGQEVSWDTNSNSLALLPFEGSVVKTYFDGSSWTDTAGRLFGFALLLDITGEFGAGAGGGVSGARIFTGF